MDPVTTAADIKNRFSHHPPSSDQVTRYDSDTAPMCITVHIATVGALRAASPAEVDRILDERFADARRELHRALAIYNATE